MFNFSRRFIFTVFLTPYRKFWMNWANAILCLLDKYLGPGLVLGVGFPLRCGWPQKTVLLLFGGIFWHLIRLWIFPCQSLRIELIISNECWFKKTKLALGCPRKASFFSIITDNLQRNSFSFINNYLPTIFRWIFRTWSGSGMVTFPRSGWPCDTVSCFVWSPFWLYYV